MTPETNNAKREGKAKMSFFSATYDVFHRFAKSTSTLFGTPWSFVIARLVIVVWGITGPIFHFSDTWQLIINTGTTIVTFLMVFLLQNTQNRDAKNTQLKLDEIIRALKGARNHLVDLERLSEDELRELESEFQRLGRRASANRKSSQDRFPDGR